MRKTTFGAAVLAAALFLPIAAYAAEPVQHDSIFPPWQHGENKDATSRGLPCTVPEVDDLADFHGKVSNPKLGGNYFLAMVPLVAAFEQQHPEFKGKIGDLPGADRQSDHPCRHPVRAEHNRDLCRRGGEGCGACGRSAALARVRPLACGALNLRALWVQALYGRHCGRLITRHFRRCTHVYSRL
jgi:hypothetical protein